MFRPKAIVFDLYGTLLDPVTVDRAARELVPESTELVTLWRRKQLEYSWLRSLMGRYADFQEVTRQALDHALKLRGVELPRAARKRLAGDFLRVEPYPEVSGTLERLSRKWDLAVLSNGTRRMIETSLGQARLRHYLKVVMSVEQAQIFKPSPRAYRLVLLRLRASRPRIVFVSSNYWDAAGAQNFGFTSCWVNRQGEPEDALGVRPRWVVRNLADLADRLGA